MPIVTRLVLWTLPMVPTPLLRRLSARYIAGERLEDALARLTALQERGFRGILDLLGEEVHSETLAREVAATYRRAASALHERKIDAYVSIKPTHLGLELSEELCLALYREVALHCRERGLFVRVEMEDHRTTDGTLRVVEALRAELGDGVGLVLQARLFRTPADIDALAPGPLDVRMVKGIYLEPAEIAHTGAEPIREAYVAGCRRLFERGARVGFATHDAAMAERLVELVRELGLGPERYEFQVLLGVQEPLWEGWRRAGHPVRVYVPYGPEWRPYSLRRIQHNPQILEHVLRAAFGR